MEFFMYCFDHCLFHLSTHSLTLFRCPFHQRIESFFCERVCYYIFTINSHFILSQQLNLLRWNRNTKKKDNWVTTYGKKQNTVRRSRWFRVRGIKHHDNQNRVHLNVFSHSTSWSHNVPTNQLRSILLRDWLSRCSHTHTRPRLEIIHCLPIQSNFNLDPLNILAALLMIRWGISNQFFWRLFFFHK